MKKYKFIIVILILFILGYIINKTINRLNIKNKQEYIIYDTIYNKTILDSIEYNIIIIDSTIKITNDEKIEYINYANSLNDNNDVIKLFYYLLSE